VTMSVTILRYCHSWSDQTTTDIIRPTVAGLQMHVERAHPLATQYAQTVLFTGHNFYGER